MASRTFPRQEQIRKSRQYLDNFLSGQTNLETNITDLEGDLNALRSQINRILDDSLTGNWYDDIPTVNSKQRSLLDLNTDLDDIEEKKIPCRKNLYADVAVPAGQNYVILNATNGETPSEVAAVSLTTLGARVAQSALSAGAFAAHELTELVGADSRNPKNLVNIIDTSTGEVFQSSNRDVYGLLQYESTGADGGAFNDTSGGNRVKISFVRANSTFDDLEAVPFADIENQNFHYAYSFRTTLDLIPEDCFLPSLNFTDLAGSGAITLEAAFANESGKALLGQNIEVSMGASTQYEYEDNTGAALWNITEGSAGGNTTLTIGAGVDQYTNSAAGVDYTQGIQVATGTTTLDVGTTAGVISSAGELTLSSNASSDLNLASSSGLNFTDTNRSGSTWSLADGVKLSSSSTDWDNFEAQFGETSLLDAIYQASQAGTAGTRVRACVTADIPANTDIGGVSGGTNLDVQLPDFTVGNFFQDYVIYINGYLYSQEDVTTAGANTEFYKGTSAANGQLKFTQNLFTDDVIDIIPRG